MPESPIKYDKLYLQFVPELQQAWRDYARMVLDRPNPAGRPVEGLTLRPGWESFVGAGPMPMIRGSTPATAQATTRAIGSSPKRPAALPDATSKAQAPSLMPEALAAVTEPSLVKAGRSFYQMEGRVLVDGRPAVIKADHVYIALHKPEGYITSCDHPGEKIVLDLVDIETRLFPVGRLDKESAHFRISFLGNPSVMLNIGRSPHRRP